MLAVRGTDKRPDPALLLSTAQLQGMVRSHEINKIEPEGADLVNVHTKPPAGVHCPYHRLATDYWTIEMKIRGDQSAARFQEF
jgi:hypothetical protein